MKLFCRLALFFLLVLSCLLPARAAVVQVQMGTYFFNPTNVVISPGDHVIWTNSSSQAHDSRSATNLWASPLVNIGGSFGFTFTNLGYYPYRCQRHLTLGPQQTGTVSVVNIELKSMLRTETNASFDVRGGRAGLRGVIEAGTNMTSWTPLSTNPFPASGTILFTNNAPLPEGRLYRARAIP